ncbi:DUF2334 domain-containing protein [Bacillus benzoevorans]|uniref:Uncharacterized protein YdaL n=2 Tax=Bacillus benzoevorans TaxID=1456 RepID=A0A7X0HNJ2_9BACI|nr:uncharacterized protein YdaL [Bacillus benzoevorans]
MKIFSCCPFFVALILLLSSQQAAYAEKTDVPKVLVIYTTIEGEIDDNLRNLDMLIGHFTKDITFISSDTVEKEDLKDVTHLFYFGEIDVQLPAAKFLNLFDDYSGQFVAIGYNSEQLSSKFSFVNQSYEAEINLLYPVDKKQKMVDLKSQNILGIEPSEGTKVLLEGKQVELNRFYPIMVQNENQYYYAFDGLYLENSIPFGNILYQVFKATPSGSHPGYIRLEDVHPLVDPKPLKEIAQILKEKNIPYMVAVIPTYTNPDTGKESRFSDSPELLKVLKQIQKDGGSIVLHGYTHQFRSSETGEGFEFWDVENNTPIYSSADKKFQMRKENDFASKEDYFSYINELQKFETKYIETKVTKGIEELSQYGLYPIAYEAPHYTMSQNGYKIVSKHFSTYVGQVQLSDTDWQVMNTTPNITSPSFLHGMRLLPETMGFYEPNKPLTILEMVNKAALIGTAEEGMYAAFYHPYLGVDGFKKVIAEMEKMPDISWIDLKQMDNRVITENIGIYTENGEIIFKRNQGSSILPSMNVAGMYVKGIIDKLVWGMAIVGAAAVMMFIIFTVYLNGRKKQIEG